MGIRFNTGDFNKCFLTAVYKTVWLREHLNGVYIEYDEKERLLTMVGTDAQLMLIKKQIITAREEEEHNFFKAEFSNGKTLQPIGAYKPKASNCIGRIEKSGDMYVIDGECACRVLEQKYPNYKAVIPACTDEPDFYVVFKPENINKADYVLGLKKGLSIVDTIPMMDSNESPAVWKEKNTAEGTEQIMIIMPRIFSTLYHNQDATQRTKGTEQDEKN